MHLEIEYSSDRSLLLRFDHAITMEAHRAVAALTPRLAAWRGVTNVHPAYASILVDIDPLIVPHREIAERAREWAAAASLPPPGTPRTVEIPVIYAGEDGPDLPEVARLTGHTEEEVIAIHSSADYLVYFLGFSPGFPYLGGMPESIAVERLETPRRSVPAGSVAIGGRQTGVYPMASPGGWRLIGRTPVSLFDAGAERPTLLEMGDHVRFIPSRKGSF